MMRTTRCWRRGWRAERLAPARSLGQSIMAEGIASEDAQSVRLVPFRKSVTLGRMDRSGRVRGLIACLLMVSASSTALGRVPPERRAQVFLVPQDTRSAELAAEAGARLKHFAETRRGVTLVRVEDLMRIRPPAELTRDRLHRELDLEPGINAFHQGRYEEAVDILSSRVRAFGEYAFWLRYVPVYSEALAYLAASHVQVGDFGRARSVYRELLLHDPDFTPDSRKFWGSIPGIVEEVRDEVESGPVGSVSVTSRPAGARVFISEARYGVTPVRITGLPVGRHILRLEQAGLMPHGEVIEVTRRGETTIRVSLEVSEEFESLREIALEAGNELGQGTIGPAFAALGAYGRVDWVVYGIARRTFTEARFDLWVIHPRWRDRLTSLHFVLPRQALEEDYLEQAFFELFEEAERQHRRGPSANRDPLSKRSGTEEWHIPRPPESRRPAHR